MKLKAILLLLSAAVVFAVPARATTTYELLFAFTGFDYQDPNTVLGPTLDHSDYLAVGEGYKVVGFVTEFGPSLSPYVSSSNEYTNQQTTAARIFGSCSDIDCTRGSPAP